MFLLFISILTTYEAKTTYHEINENEYILKIIKQIKPINFNNYNVLNIWFFGLIFLFVFRYFGLVKPQEKNINKIQKIILAIAIPLILIIISIIIMNLLNITDEVGSLIIISITLIIITIYEYDLFGKNIIIRAFDFKLLLKTVIFFIIFFIGIGLLGEIFPPVNIGREKIFQLTKEEYENQSSPSWDKIWKAIEK
jgi:hypothetical protein